MRVELKSISPKLEKDGDDMMQVYHIAFVVVMKDLDEAVAMAKNIKTNLKNVLEGQTVLRGDSDADNKE